jgi:putative peptidoglycan lipid II flippase
MRESVQWRIFGNTLTVAGFTALVKVFGAAKIVVTAGYFGTADTLDAFLIAFLIPSFVAEVAAGSLGPSLIPTLIEVREQRGENAARRLCGSVLAGSAVLLTGLAVLLAIGSSWILPLFGSGFDPAKRHLTRWFFLMLLPWLPLSALIVTWRAVLNASERFAVAAGASVLTPLATIVLLWIVAPSWRTEALVAGVLLGVCAEAAILAWAVGVRGFPLLPRWRGWTPELRQVGAQYLPMIAGAVILTGSPLVDQAMAGTLGPGSVSALTYGTKLASVLIGIAAVGLSTAVLPHLSRMLAAGDSAAVQRTVRTWAALALSVAIPLACILALWSEPLVRLLYQRGAFTADATHGVAVIQSFSMTQLAPAVLLALGLRLATAMKANALLMRVALLGLVANIALDAVLMRYLGVSGIALAGSGVAVISLGYLACLLRWRTRVDAI